MKTVLAVISLIIVFASCNTPRYAYSPTAHNVPILTRQGDSKLAANYSNNITSTATDDDDNQYEKSVSHGFDLQGAVAVTNNIALQANYFYRSEKTTSTSSSYSDFARSSVKYQRRLFEFGAGYFTPVDKKQRMLFQVYAGAGLGKTKIADDGIEFSGIDYHRNYNTNITKFYLEPSITFRMKEIFAATVATRASIVKFRNIETNYSLLEKQDFNLDSLDRFAVAFFEPAFVGSFGFNKLPGFRIELQAGLCVLWEESFIDYRPFNFSVGLVFDIGKLIKGSGGKTGD